MTTPLDTIDRLQFDVSGMVLSEVVEELIARYGVPSDMDEVYTLATALMGPVLEERGRIAARATEVIASTVSSSVKVATPDFLPLPYVMKDVSKAVGLSPYPKNVVVSMLDEVSQKMAKVSILPFTASDNPEVVVSVSARLVSTSTHRALDAQREVVHNTAKDNRVKWAWRLTGRENCNSCLAKASYGPFWADEAGANRITHDNCDCYAELVPDYDKWSGKDTAEELDMIIRYNSEKSGSGWKKPDWAAIKEEFEMERTDVPR